jgi:TRAP transporter 4TM/12TM fusion protein
MRIGKYEIKREKLIVILSAFIVLFNLYSLVWFPPSPYVHRGIFMSVFILLVALMSPSQGKSGQILMALFTLMALTGTVYPMIFEDKLMTQNMTASSTEVLIFIIFAIGLAALLTRVPAGVSILVMAIGAVFYFFWGQYIPGYFGHKPWPLTYTVTFLYTDLDHGAFGNFTEQSCRLIAIYMIFAAFLSTAGLGDLFSALSQWIAGNATGGPAKVSVLSSAAFGMISGSPIANVVATGSFTIPLMNKVGYEPRMSATVEALASTGGNLMPPIMGIGAFLMAEILGISYFKVCAAAIIPTFCWYFTVYMIVHFYACGHSIRKWRPSREEVKSVLKAKAHLGISVLILIATMLYTGNAEQAALFGTLSLFLLTFLRKETRLNKAKVADLMERYAKMFAPLFILMICLGVFIGAFSASGVHTKIGEVLIGGVENWLVVILIVFGLVVALGTILPIAASYLAAVVVVAPILAPLGTDPLVIHMFVFYVATLAPLTPPTAGAVYTAARLAGADMVRTSIYSTIKGLPLWILPFAIFRKSLIVGVGTPLSVLCMETAILCVGILIFVIGSEGYFFRPLKTYEKMLAMGIGLMVVQPVSSFYSRIFCLITILLLGLGYLEYRFGKRKKVEMIPEE